MTLLQIIALVKKLYPIFKELGVRVKNNVAKARIKIARKRTDIKKDQRPLEKHVSGTSGHHSRRKYDSMYESKTKTRNRDVAD